MYGPLDPSRQRNLPRQDNNTVMLLADRFVRSHDAQTEWALAAKTCTEFVEGQQYSASELKQIEERGGPAFTFNKVGPLVRLVQGYHRNNRTDIKYLPGGDDTASDEMVAESITKLAKQIGENTQEPYIDAEVFSDGIVTGRGYYDWRLNFEKNDLGVAETEAADPFAVYLDPDGYHYDINKSAYVITTRWASMNEVESSFGPAAAAMVLPFFEGAGGFFEGLPASILDTSEDITPWRTFGGEQDRFYSRYGGMGDFMANIIDYSRRTIRIVDMQHYIRSKMRVAVDLETGMRKPFPDDWPPERIQKFFAWAQEKSRIEGRAMSVRYEERMVRRVRWTIAVGDILVYDDWSPYKTFTIIPFFPYFRRGKTRGMVDDLLDPQREINKRRSSNIDMVTRTANGGWKVHENAMDDDEMQDLEDFGAAPGYVLRWRGSVEPEQIQPSAPNMKFERLEQRATDDLNEISGINRDMMGQDEKVKSGRAIEARQKTGILSVQVYMDNMARTKELVGRKKLELIQDHYREQRLIRLLGEDGKLDTFVINQRTVSGQIINDVGLGTYTLSIDETPLSASFMQAQFEELMEMIREGVLPIQAVMDIAVDLSTIPQKEAIKQRISHIMGAQGIPTGDEAGMIGHNGGPPMMGEQPAQVVLPPGAA